MSQTVPDLVFGLLRRRGPLSVAQISVELSLPLEEVTVTLELLRQERAAQVRPDDDKPVTDPALVVWGLPVSVLK